MCWRQTDSLQKVKRRGVGEEAKVQYSTIVVRRRLVVLESVLCRSASYAIVFFFFISACMLTKLGERPSKTHSRKINFVSTCVPTTNMLTQK